MSIESQPTSTNLVSQLSNKRTAFLLSRRSALLFYSRFLNYALVISLNHFIAKTIVLVITKRLSTVKDVGISQEGRCQAKKASEARRASQIQRNDQGCVGSPEGTQGLLSSSHREVHQRELQGR